MEYVYEFVWNSCGVRNFPTSLFVYGIHILNLQMCLIPLWSSIEEKFVQKKYWVYDK